METLNKIFYRPKNIKNYLKQNKLNFNKNLGQNFLINANIINKIIKNANVANCAVIEVGAGLGVLTNALAKNTKKVVAIELDGGFCSMLKQHFHNVKNVEILNYDILKINLNNLLQNKFNNDTCKIKICANLPYYLTSKFIANVLKSRIKINELILMVQKEVAKRFCAQPGSKNCSTISYLIHYYSVPQILFEVGKKNFYPIPKVDSCCLKLTIKSPNTLTLIKNDEIQFFNFIKAAFSQRRKFLISPIAKHLNCNKIELANVMTNLKLNCNSRAQNLNLKQFIMLFQQLKQLKFL